MIGHWIGAVSLLVVGLAGIRLSRALPGDATQELGTSFFPLLVSLFICGCSIVILLSLFLKGNRTAPPISWPNGPARWRIASSLLFLAGYTFTLERLGFLLSTFLLLLLFSKFVFGKPWAASLCVALIAVLSSFGLLSWALGVRLPVSPWAGV